MNIFNICIRDLSSPASAVLRKAREIVKMGQGIMRLWSLGNTKQNDCKGEIFLYLIIIYPYFLRANKVLVVYQRSCNISDTWLALYCVDKTLISC